MKYLNPPPEGSRYADSYAAACDVCPVCGEGLHLAETCPDCRRTVCGVHLAGLSGRSEEHGGPEHDCNRDGKGGAA